MSEEDDVRVVTEAMAAISAMGAPSEERRLLARQKWDAAMEAGLEPVGPRGTDDLREEIAALRTRLKYAEGVVEAARIGWYAHWPTYDCYPHQGEPCALCAGLDAKP